MARKEKSTTGAQVAIASARKHRTNTDPDAPITLSTGVRAIIKGVPPALIEDATRGIKDPDVPREMDENKGREIENPYHPSYLKAVAAANEQRGIASMDVMIMFGVELVDPIPPQDEWLKKILYLAKRGTLSFDPALYDLEDELELEFIYKRFVAVGGADLILVSDRSGMPTEALQSAEDTF